MRSRGYIGASESSRFLLVHAGPHACLFVPIHSVSVARVLRSRRDLAIVLLPARMLGMWRRRHL